MLWLLEATLIWTHKNLKLQKLFMSNLSETLLHQCLVSAVWTFYFMCLCAFFFTPCNFTPHKTAKTLLSLSPQNELNPTKMMQKLRSSRDTASLTHLVVLLLLLVMHWALPRSLIRQGHSKGNEMLSLPTPQGARLRFFAVESWQLSQNF